MNGSGGELLSYFRLRPTRAAKVSEISEATASSAIPSEDRVNFHIGNPIQDERLASAYLRAALGLDIRDESLGGENPAGLLHALNWGEAERPILELFFSLIRKSAPYLPRGGYARSTPPPLIKAFCDWLRSQQDPLTYDLGEASGRREIILASGGTTECMRVVFHAISQFIAQPPARVLLFRTQFPPHLLDFASLQFEPLPQDEHEAIDAIEREVSSASPRATFVVLGEITAEETRRRLRTMSLSHPLFFLEINNAPNHLSLARESRLIDRVIRVLSPTIFSPRFRGLSLMFLAGNAEYLSLIETVHFQLKGTPSASEVELLEYLLEKAEPVPGNGEPAMLPIEPPTELPAFRLSAERVLAQFALRAERSLDAILSSRREILEAGSRFAERGSRVLQSFDRLRGVLPVTDRFHDLGAASLVRTLNRHLDEPGWMDDLRESFLRAFHNHHPEYDIDSCTVVSGSARTALSLLGFHCGIRSVIIPDLSWTYEHCFPTVHTVPLTTEFGLDCPGILQAVRDAIASDPRWTEHGAVVLNNPHNATGRVFDIPSLQLMIQQLLEMGVTVIDDLSYQNVAPSENLPEIPTLRHISDELVRTGRLTSAHTAHLITAHSLSKTDCLAGARLSVIEIRDREIRERFRNVSRSIVPNTGAIMMSYLFYRNSLEVARTYWRLRNVIFKERMAALSSAVQNLPADRNPFDIDILPPTGSMYPMMVIRRLPPGLSLEWVAAGLARQGIGLIPLSTFARTGRGFDTGRMAFRLTLGGTDGAPTLLDKTRRVLIDLNRLIAEESAQYSRKTFVVHNHSASQEGALGVWLDVERAVQRRIQSLLENPPRSLGIDIGGHGSPGVIRDSYAKERLQIYRRRFLDRYGIMQEQIASAQSDGGKALGLRLEREFYRDNLQRREEAFRARLFDRTVHPTQMYSIRTDAVFDEIISALLRQRSASVEQLERASKEMIREYLGLNVGITSFDESDEVIVDLDSHISAELFGEIEKAGLPQTFLSFWGDWDGSNRPSGQGHQLIASVLLQNVRRLSVLLRTLSENDSSVHVTPELIAELDRLPGKTHQFVSLLQDITALTHQLERRYRGILPFQARTGRLRQLGMTLHLARDPVTSLWYHNDRLERRMKELRAKRRQGLEYYFALNKRLRKEMHRLVPAIQRNVTNQVIIREAVSYRDLLGRFVITPRIHQNMVTAQDPFAVETTAFNINEINEIGARFGNPGTVLALQVSMSSRPEPLIELDRKLRARREHVLRDYPDIALPSLRLIPLFEDLESVQGITGYVNKLWEYALQSRRLNQETRERFAEMVDELFIAGSDLSQHVSQAAGAHLYRQAKYDLLRWLAQHGLADRVRLKLGSGEPMQRQGGYYGELSGTAAFVQSEDATRRFGDHLRESTRRSTVYATTPMLGVFAGGDLRTFQSAISERVRHLGVEEFSQLLYHLAASQKTHRRDLARASEEFAESRLMSTKRSERALERLTVGTREEALEGFLKVLTENFRQILYGREEDVVGVHIISYFIARSTPPLRDRPTVRPGPAGKGQGSRILERIAETIPFARYGSLLRAIAHNQAQTAVLGINQLTTGLFRALDTFAQGDSVKGDPETFLADRILPHLPVYEILSSLRLYHDVDQQYLQRIERAFPAGNSAFLALREDLDAMARYIPLMQQELLRRHGIEVSDFFESSRFLPDLLPTLRPDLGVLMQQDLFNTDPEKMLGLVGKRPDQGWVHTISRLLTAPEEIRRWRAHAWELLETPVFERVEAFVELAVSLYSLSSRRPAADAPAGFRSLKIPSRLDHFFRMSRTGDEMRDFLAGAIEYLSVASEGGLEVPANIIRAMKEVERIAAIEEQALTNDQQARLRFCLLQIARITGESG